MLRYRTAAIALMLGLFIWPCRLSDGGDFGELPPEHDLTEEEGDYIPVSLPLSAKAARTWIALHETMVTPPPDQTTFGDIIKLLKVAVRGDGVEPPPFELYINPAYLVELNNTTPIPAVFVGEEMVSLHTYLKYLLRPYVLAHRVHDGLVIIEGPCDDCPEEPPVTASEAWTWLVLQEEIPLSYAEETPVGEVLRAVQAATEGKGKDGRGLAIWVDHLRLSNVKQTLESTVTIEVERIPLCTALDLVLNQCDLGFRVEANGLLVVTRRDKAAEITDFADLSWEYQYQLYAAFHERKLYRHMRIEELIEYEKRGTARDRPGPGMPAQEKP